MVMYVVGQDWLAAVHVSKPYLHYFVGVGPTAINNSFLNA